MIEFWLRWNCNFCYPSHAKSTFSLSRPPPNMVQNLFKKTLCNRTPQKSSICNLRAPLDGNMNRKGFQKSSFWGGQEHQKVEKTVPKGIQSAVENQLPKTGRVFLEMGAKMYSQSNIIWPKSSRKRSLEMSWMKQTRGSNKHILWLGDGAKSQ